MRLLAMRPVSFATVVLAALLVLAVAVPAQAAEPVLTRYDQSAGEISYSGEWSSTSKSRAFDRSYLRTKDAGASVNIAFDGARLDLIATQGSTGGPADIYLDGLYVKTVTLRTSSSAYQSHIWSTGDLAPGVHTLRIVRSAGATSGSYINIDAVDVAGTLVPCRWVGQDSTLLARAGAALTVGFAGSHLTWMGQKDAAGGTVRVTVDEFQPLETDLQGAPAPQLQKLWETSHLPAGEHTVRIEWPGAGAESAAGTAATPVAAVPTAPAVTAAPSAAAAAPAADGSAVVPAAAPGAGFLVVGQVTQSYVWQRVEESDPRVLYWGTWTAGPATEASGGSDTRAAAAGSAVTVTFSGKELVWLATTGPGLGKAAVSVDGGAAQAVDLTGAVAAYQQRVWSSGALTPETHTVEITWDKTNAAGAAVAVDAFEVLGFLPSAADTGALRTLWAEQKLTALSYRPGIVDGKVDRATRGAVIAFQKWEGMTRSGKLSDEVFSRLLTAARPTPSKKGESESWIEVNKAKQLLLYCKAGVVLWTIPVSTGSPSVGYDTPSRTYKITRKTLETNPRWHPLYIAPRGRYLAIHGYPSVPTHRASHGCIRTQIWDQKDLHPLIAVGTYVYVY